MASVRIVVARRGRVEIHELPGPDLFVGRGPGADVAIDDERLAERHAHVLLRRGRVIVTDLGRGRAGISRGDERVRAPIAVTPDEVLRLGDITMSLSVADPDRPSLVGTRIDGARVVEEHPTPDAGVRAYRLDDDRWITVVVGGHARDAEPGEDEVDATFALPDGRVATVQSVGAQVPAAALFDAIDRGLVALPVEAAAVLACHLLEAVAEYHRRRGPHGAIEPRRLHVGLDGTLRLWSPGPIVDLADSALDPFLAPERRYGLPPSFAADAYAAGVLARRLLAGHGHLAPLEDVLVPLFATRPTDRTRHLDEVARALVDATLEAGLDATYQHAARAVRVIAGPLCRPIVR